MPRTYKSYNVEHHISGGYAFALACASLQSMVIGGSGVTDILRVPQKMESVMQSNYIRVGVKCMHSCR